MDPGSSLGTHFHFQDQFQLVIKGGGTIGRSPLQRFSLHYASGHTGYGPLVAGEGGMTYYTIRAITDGPGHYLPGAREEMQAVNTDGVEPMSHPQELAQRLREDAVSETDRRAAYQSIAPQTEAGLYLVPKVIE